MTLNTATSAISTTYTVGGTGSTSGTVTPYLTNNDSNTAAQPALALASGGFSATVPARSLVTYVVKGGTVRRRACRPPPPPPTTPPAGTGCVAAYAVTGSWQGGFQAGVTVTNTGSSVLNGWTVRWTLPSGQSITELWNGSLATSGSAVSVTNLSYNGTLNPGAATTFGFTGSGSGASPPAAVTCTAT